VAASASERDEHLAGADGAVAARLQFDRAAPGRAADRSPAAVPSRRTPAGAREATASEPGSAVVNQFRIWLARHCRLTFRLALSSEITRIPEARSKGSPRGSVFFALLTRSKTSFTDLNRVNRRPSVCRGMRRHLAIGAARGWSRGSLELQPDDSLKNKIGKKFVRRVHSLTINSAEG
jgi:hypothetical protein